MKYLNFLGAVFIVSFSGPEPLYTIEKLNQKINTKYDEINPVVSIDGKTIYFTRVGHPAFDKTLKVDEADFSKTLSFPDYRQKLQEIYQQLGEEDCSDPVASAFNQDIWIAQSERNIFDNIEHPTYPLNSALPNSVCAITTDPSMIVIVNQFFKDGSMQKGFSFAKKDHLNKWKFPEPIFIYDYHNIEAGVNLTLSKDNEVMILSLAKEDSQGKNDLYVSFRIHTTLWSAPDHMGKIINTKANEITPFISDDKQFLFFSSDREGSFGGQDIFVSERLDESWTNWSVPEALPYPINSTSNDAQPFLNRQTGFLYFTSTRDGSSDIFRVKYFQPESVKSDSNRPLLSSDKKTPKSNITCVVVDAITGEALDAKIKYGSLQVDDFTFDGDISKGGLNFDPAQERLLKFEVRREGYITRTQKIDLSNKSSFADGLLKISMDPIRVNTRISMDPIFFMRGNDRILSGSYDELDRLASILKQHANIHVNINGHTDSVGDSWALYQLSENRALAVKQYLVKVGIPSFRIKTKGYGPSKPITDNSSEDLRAKNRRVEVVITRT